MDWKEAEEYLKECEEAYESMDRVGRSTLLYVVYPLRDRYEEGERTQELYDQICNLSC